MAVCMASAVPRLANVAGFTAGGGAVYLASHNDDSTSNELIALDSATGRQLWTASGRGIPLAAGATAGVVYGRTGGSDSPVAVVDAATGAPLWNHSAFWGYLGSGSTMFVSTTATVNLMTMGGDVIALDIRTGRKQWQRDSRSRRPTFSPQPARCCAGWNKHWRNRSARRASGPGRIPGAGAGDRSDRD
jgi:outer membrane protein assembly factor BamB